MFNHNRVKISKERKTPLFQINPYVDYLTTEEFIRGKELFAYRLYVIHPFEALNQYTKEKMTFQIGDILDFSYQDRDRLGDEWIPIDYQPFSHSFIEYRYNYGKEEYTVATKENQYYTNRDAVFECTIPYYEKFYFWISWKGLELDYTPKKSFFSIHNEIENIEIAANILGFLRFRKKSRESSVIQLPR